MVGWGNLNIFTYLFGQITPVESYAFLFILAIVAIIGLSYVVKRVRNKRKDPNEPLTTLDEMDKSGLVHIYEIAKEQEGASFLEFERSNGTLETRIIGQPFTFFMENGTIERHHFNARGSIRCINPLKLFKKYVPSLLELNNLAAFTEQLIRALRIGAMVEERPIKHLRTFIMIFLLSGLIGLGIAAATVRRG